MVWEVILDTKDHRQMKLHSLMLQVDINIYL